MPNVVALLVEDSPTHLLPRAETHAKCPLLMPDFKGTLNVSTNIKNYPVLDLIKICSAVLELQHRHTGYTDRHG
jgi:hypothetical protein